MIPVNGAAIPPTQTIWVGERKPILQQVWKTISDSDKIILRRILDVSYQYKLSHLGSCLSAAPIIKKIYEISQHDDIFILSSGHAALALYCVLEWLYGCDAEALFKKHGVHPNRDMEHGIYLSTGSLGQGITVACGTALASPEKHVYCLISDGECAEGSVWEALRFIHEHPLDNITVVCNANGYSALNKVNLDYLEMRLKAFLPEIVFVRSQNQFNGIPKGIEAHYHVLSESNFLEAIHDYD